MIVLLSAMGEATLHCLGCIMPFLERDQIDSLPYVTSLTMAVFPRALHQKIVNALCFYVLPFTIGSFIPYSTKILNEIYILSKLNILDF